MDATWFSVVVAATSATTTQIITGVGIGAFLGAVLSALLTQWMTNRRENKSRGLQRTGIARVLYQDFLRQQSTLARAFYRGDWWRPEEVASAQVDDSDVKFLATDLDDARWTDVASALGWMAYLAKVRGTGIKTAPNEHDVDTFIDVYGRLDLGRFALCNYADLAWAEHDDHEMRKAAEESAELRPWPGKKLPVLDVEKAEQRYADPFTSSSV